MRRPALAFALSLLASAAGAQDDMSVRPDRTGDAGPAGESEAAAAFRNRPVRCQPGEIEYFAGKTLGDVFGDAWPAAPASLKFERPTTLRRGIMQWPRGLGQDGAAVMTATLVGADGRAVDARALCATAPAISEPAVRAAKGGRYTPAKFDGVPGMGIVFSTWRYRFRNDEPPPRRRSP